MYINSTFCSVHTERNLTPGTKSTNLEPNGLAQVEKVSESDFFEECKLVFTEGDKSEDGIKTKIEQFFEILHPQDFHARYNREKFLLENSSTGGNKSL